MFLLDEPLSNLDAKLRKEMRAEIDRLHQKLKKTFIYVTHDQEEAMTLADRIVVMRDGHIDQVGTPLEIYHDPVNRFVADFFGSPPMNLLDGALHQENGALAFRAGEFNARLTGPVPGIEGKATLGIRPEYIAISDDDHADGVDFNARVALVEPLGKDTLLYLDYGSESNLIAVIEGHREIRPDTTVGVHLQHEKTVFLRTRRASPQARGRAQHDFLTPPAQSGSHKFQATFNFIVRIETTPESTLSQEENVRWESLPLSSSTCSKGSLRANRCRPL